MITPPPWDQIAAEISAATGRQFTIARRSSLGGGCINDACLIEGGGRRYFVKLNRAEKAEMFAAEAEGLAEILATKTIRVPAPLCHGAGGSTAWLVLEYLELGGRGDARELGRRLAALHRCTGTSFGWRRDNTIGSTPQVNTPGNDWLAFWRERRLGFQLRLAAKNGLRGALQAKGERLMDRLTAFFPGYAPAPSLLHGDLWGGNHGYAASGEPVIFDPAVYYGDREADLAMTELFAGFGSDFYKGYREAWPLDAGYAVRKNLYNLYHVLNHANLFGGGYGSQAEAMMERLLAEAG
ncbi:MAG TPA: fructosamine kinase family protein [Burkholderiales bacterium]|nr:fructosamine kinase family protein [Burkholderiales bacterium]